jgi:hypothetical protein
MDHPNKVDLGHCEWKAKCEGLKEGQRTCGEKKISFAAGNKAVAKRIYKEMRTEASA